MGIYIIDILIVYGYFLFSWFFWFLWWYVGRWSLTLLDLMYIINMGLHIFRCSKGGGGMGKVDNGLQNVKNLENRN